MYVIDIAHVAIVGGVVACNGRPIYRLKWSPGLYKWINISRRRAIDLLWKGIFQTTWCSDLCLWLRWLWIGALRIIIGGLQLLCGGPEITGGELNKICPQGATVLWYIASWSQTVFVSLIRCIKIKLWVFQYKKHCKISHHCFFGNDEPTLKTTIWTL